ncbi:MAG: zinc transporter ZntB [Pseudomonadota bacterium]
MTVPNTICAFDITDGRVETVSDVTTTSPTGGYRWLHFDLAEPGLNEWLGNQLPSLVAGTLMQSETRPRCDVVDGGIILNLRGVNLNPGASPEDMVSLRLWVTPDLIVSTRARKVFAVDAMREKLESGSSPETVGHFISVLAQGLAKRIETVSLELEEATDSLEDIVLNDEASLGVDVARLRQTIIKLRRYLAPQREALDTLSEAQVDILDEKNRKYLGETANRTRRALEELDACRDRLNVLSDHIDAAASNALNKNSYVLSVVAAIFLPLGFLTGLFGVNVAGMPGLDTPFAFWALSLASVAMGVALFAVFRILKWL